MLKRIILLSVILCSFSCSKTEVLEEEEITLEEVFEVIAPPKWIQGTWKLEESMSYDLGWKFTENDVFVISSNEQDSQKEDLVSLKTSAKDIQIENEATDDKYSLSIIFPDGRELKYEFERKGNHMFTWMQIPDSFYIKQ